MNKPVKIVLSIVIGLVILAVGVSLGFFYEKTTQPPVNYQGADNMASIIKTLSSRTISVMSAYGQVTNIEGNNITLSYRGDSMTIGMAQDSGVYSSLDNNAQNKAATSTTEFSTQKGTLSDIKKGDTVILKFIMLPTGQLEGSSITIFPQAPPTKK